MIISWPYNMCDDTNFTGGGGGGECPPPRTRYPFHSNRAEGFTSTPSLCRVPEHFPPEEKSVPSAGRFRHQLMIICAHYVYTHGMVIGIYERVA